ncbi:MAG: hypothetical protein ACLQME_14615 [Alphaproteobacteria bacterium]
MPDINTTLEARVKVRCILLVQDFAHEIVEEWKGWLTGSLPMAGLAIIGLVNPDWVHLPLWAWALLIFVAGLLFAMFRVYRELRRQRDVLHERLGSIGIAGPFMLVPFSGDLHLDTRESFRKERITNDM